MDDKTYNIIDDCFETLFVFHYNKRDENGYYEKACECLNTLNSFKNELNFSSLLDVAIYYIEIFNDTKRAKEIGVST